MELVDEVVEAEWRAGLRSPSAEPVGVVTIDADGLAARMSLDEAARCIVVWRSLGFRWLRSGLWSPSRDRQMTEWTRDTKDNRVLVVNPSILHHVGHDPAKLPITETTGRGIVVTDYTPVRRDVAEG